MEEKHILFQTYSDTSGRGLSRASHIYSKIRQFLYGGITRSRGVSLVNFTLERFPQGWTRSLGLVADDVSSVSDLKKGKLNVNQK